MMGQLSSGQERLFYSFNLEDHIPTNHLLRSIDQCLDLSDLRHYLADRLDSLPVLHGVEQPSPPPFPFPWASLRQFRSAPNLWSYRGQWQA